MPASSDASSALSTASFTQVRSAFRGLSKPSRWRFLVKNSETEISRWRAPISTADTTVAIDTVVSDPLSKGVLIAVKSASLACPGSTQRRTDSASRAGGYLQRETRSPRPRTLLDIRADFVIVGGKVFLAT